MKKFDLPLILDSLFYAFCAFMLSVGILRYFRAATWVVFTCSALIAIALGTASFLLIYTKHRRNGLTKEAQKQRSALMLHLTLERTDRVVAALAAAYRADGKAVKAGAETLAVDGMTVIPLFTMQPVSADAVAVLLKRYGNEPFMLACNDLSPEARSLLTSFGRTTAEGGEIYAMFLRTDTVPSPLICGEIPRFKLKAKLRRTFSKSNARPFFVSGSLLLLMSLFTFFPLYYLITGSILLIAAVSIRLLGYA